MTSIWLTLLLVSLPIAVTIFGTFGIYGAVRSKNKEFALSDDENINLHDVENKKQSLIDLIKLMDRSTLQDNERFSKDVEIAYRIIGKVDYINQSDKRSPGEVQKVAKDLEDIYRELQAAR